MRHGTHELVGVSVALAGARVLEAPALETAGAAVAAFYGSWLPDIDQLGSRVHRRSAPERRSLVAGLVGVVLRLPVLAFAVIARHRGVCHSLAGAFLAGLLAALVCAPVGGAVWIVVGGGVFAGYMAHLAADALTPSGVPLWVPLSRRRVWLLPRAWRIPTGSWREGGVTFLAGVAVVALLAI
jgi:inner membrane protein